MNYTKMQNDCPTDALDNLFLSEELKTQLIQDKIQRAIQTRQILSQIPTYQPTEDQ
jgi:hypothetical protein